MPGIAHSALRHSGSAGDRIDADGKDVHDDGGRMPPGVHFMAVPTDAVLSALVACRWELEGAIARLAEDTSGGGDRPLWTGDECPICLQEVPLEVELSCRHRLCQACYRALRLVSSVRCPLCRALCRAREPADAVVENLPSEGYLVMASPRGKENLLGLHCVGWTTLRQRLGVHTGRLSGTGRYLRWCTSTERIRVWWNHAAPRGRILVHH